MENEQTLSEARREYFRGVEKGVICPCCDRRGEAKSYPMNAAALAALRFIVESAGPTGWVNVQATAPRWMLRSKKHSLLKFWGLITPRYKSNFKEDGTVTPGVFKATKRGLDFFYGRIFIPKRMVMYNRGRLRFEDGEICAADVPIDWSDFSMSDIKIRRPRPVECPES